MATKHTTQDAYEKIRKSLFDSIETAGKWECPWLKSLFEYNNPLSGHTFTGFVNLALLAMRSANEGWTDSRFVTVSQVRKLGKGAWWIKKDELAKGTWLYRPRLVKDKGTGENTFIGWSVYKVYSADQCEKRPDLPTLEGRDIAPLEHCEATVAAMPLLPTIAHGGGRACWSPSSDNVTMPERRAFKSSEEYYSTLFHELAHATSHKTRLDRPRPSYAREELVAEASAAILCAVHGVEGRTIENSKAYVKHWNEECANDPKLFPAVMRDAMAAAEWIMGRKAKAKGSIKSEELN